MDRKFLLLTVCLLLIGLQHPLIAKTKNGFNLDNASIPLQKIISGGPPKDGIPAIMEPKFMAADDAHFMAPDDRIMGITVNGQSRAYPIKILNHHEVVNDQIDGQNFVVSYCPLCGTGMVFSTNAWAKGASGATIKGALLFGVSGLLYNSDVLLYDMNTESLWSQILRESVAGPLKGTRLKQLPAQHTNWSDWQSKHPDTQVLSTETGYRRNYNKNPYQGYERTRKLMFSVSHKAPKRFHPKQRVMGVEFDGQFKAYPFSELSKLNSTSFFDEIGHMRVKVMWNEQASTASIQTASGEEIVTTIAFWFAWYTFHPETDIFIAPEAE